MVANPGEELAQRDGTMTVGRDPFVIRLIRDGVHVCEVSNFSRGDANAVNPLANLKKGERESNTKLKRIICLETWLI